MIQFMVKDKSVKDFNTNVKMILYTMNGICNKFFNGILPGNLYKEQASRQQIEKYLTHILRFNVYLDAIVEKK